MLSGCTKKLLMDLKSLKNLSVNTVTPTYFNITKPKSGFLTIDVMGFQQRVVIYNVLLRLRTYSLSWKLSKV